MDPCLSHWRRVVPLLLTLLITCSAESAQETQADAVPTPAQLEAAGAVIGEIIIDAQNIFDSNDPKENSSLYRAANAVHITTRERVIRQQLLFHPGDVYSQRELEESERILRSARYLYDASIRPIAYHDGRVDIAVTTRDVWTLNPGVSFGRHGGVNTFGFELEELNILGTGTSITASHKSGIDRDSNALEFKDHHVAGTWTSLATQYADNSDGSTFGLSLEHPFYSLDTRWAAGGMVFDDDKIESLYDRGQVVDQFRDHIRQGMIYGGWSEGLVNGWTKRWTYGVTYDDEQFEAAPTWTGTQLLPEDRTLVYPWIGYELIQNDYLKLRNRDQIGRTEDFYLGARLAASLGWADRSFGSDRNALMFSASGGYGFGPSERTTLLLTTKAMGRLEDGELRNTMIDAAIRYYAQQSPRRLFFATLSATAGLNLDLDNQILLGGDNGLRGYPLRYQSGDSRALLTVEERYFTNWYPFRLFRIGGAIFFDVGRTWGSTPVSAPNLGVLKDVGFGLRIGNTRSGLGNVIHVDLAFPLDGDSSIDKVQLLVETKQQF